MVSDENPLYSKAYKFAIRAIRAYEYLSDGRSGKKNYDLAKQLLKSGTSVAANITEANGALSKAHFSLKISIAYKEALETKLWLGLLRDTEYIDAQTYSSMYNDIDEISKILYASLNTTRLSPKNRKGQHA